MMYLQVKYQDKSPLNNAKTINNGQKCKRGHVKGRVTEEVRGKMKRVIWLMYFPYMNEYGTLNPIEVI
jgi:hypothetical protein